MTTTLQIRKDQLATSRIVDSADTPLADGQVRVAIDHFAYTSNNITYAAFGDAMNYWQFFPVPPQDAAGKAALKAYGMRFAQTLVQDLKNLAGISVFATSDTRHGVINSTSEWSTTTVDSLLLPAVFGAWYANPCAAPVTHIATP